jgi:1,4-dihydroxy-2-naphthoate octaprenyltransferase
MVANLLYINQFPDAVADARAGKMTLVARLGRHRAVGGYALIALGAVFALLLGVALGLLPPLALAALLALLPGSAAYRRLLADAERPAKLRPAIFATLAAVHLFGLLLAAACVFG